MQIKTEKRVVETYVTTYTAEDGKEFFSEGECKAYERDIKIKELKEKAEQFEIKDLYGTYPLDVDGQQINDNHEYKWYKISSEEDLKILSGLYDENFVYPITETDIVCIEYDGDYRCYPEAWIYWLSDMKKSTIEFWKSHGFDIEFKER